jgi:hypothetical protein
VLIVLGEPFRLSGKVDRFGSPRVLDGGAHAKYLCLTRPDWAWLSWAVLDPLVDWDVLDTGSVLGPVQNKYDMVAIGLGSGG